MRRPHLALVGPTASGKSALAAEAARRLGDVELVSIDSMQVYRRMDIGTAKDRAVPHHLVDLVDPSEAFSVARFQAAAHEALAGIEERGHRALLVGGTGLYLQTIVDGLTVPGEWPELRAELEAQASTPDGLRLLFERLRSADPDAAGRIGPGNARRIVRAMEVTLGSGRRFSSFGPGLAAFPRTFRFRLAGVWLPRRVVNDRIAARYRAQMAAGFLEEVASLGPLARTARQALGYRELLAHLEGRMTLEQALDEAIRRTCAFARRQRMWFRRDPRIVWFGTAANPVALLPALLGNWSS